MVSAAGSTDYGAIFDHVFVSADGNVASLENAGVGERFTCRSWKRNRAATAKSHLAGSLGIPILSERELRELLPEVSGS